MWYFARKWRFDRTALITYDGKAFAIRHANGRIYAVAAPRTYGYVDSKCYIEGAGGATVFLWTQWDRSQLQHVFAAAGLSESTDAIRRTIDASGSFRARRAGLIEGALFVAGLVWIAVAINIVARL